MTFRVSGLSETPAPTATVTLAPTVQAGDETTPNDETIFGDETTETDEETVILAPFEDDVKVPVSQLADAGSAAFQSSFLWSLLVVNMCLCLVVVI